MLLRTVKLYTVLYRLLISTVGTRGGYSTHLCYPAKKDPRPCLMEESCFVSDLGPKLQPYLFALSAESGQGAYLSTR